MWKLFKSEILYYGKVFIVEYFILSPVLVAHIYLSKSQVQGDSQQWPAIGFVLLTIGVLFILAYTRTDRTKTKRQRLLISLPIPRTSLFWLRLLVPFLFWLCLWTASLIPFTPDIVQKTGNPYPVEFLAISLMLFLLILFGYSIDDLRYYRIASNKWTIMVSNGIIVFAYISYLVVNLSRYDLRPYRIFRQYIPTALDMQGRILFFLVGIGFLLLVNRLIFDGRKFFLE
ncbi:hypothetical protein EH223_16120 [candidate division KSB1 bacterium]|nr:hypothetical protein [candidate division KSB1 bacterium]RQW01053.1 MAG: hypothetical protein EH223_16120 [candidate division KSB1 bacterium]